MTNLLVHNKWITYHMLCAVLEATRRNPLLHGVTDSDMAAAVHDWPRYAPDREGGRRERALTGVNFL